MHMYFQYNDPTCNNNLDGKVFFNTSSTLGSPYTDNAVIHNICAIFFLGVGY